MAVDAQIAGPAVATELSGRRTVLVAGNYRPALTAARRLKAMGYRVLLGMEPGATGAEHSRFVDEIWALPAPGRGAAAFREALRVRLRLDPSIVAIMPMTETYLNLVDAARDLVPPDIRVVAPQPRVIEICHDKFAWLRFCCDIGIPTPAFDTASRVDNLRSVVEAIGPPVVIRPVEAGQRIGKRKAVAVYDRAGFTAAFESWPEGVGDLLVQKRFEGIRYNVYFGALDGAIVRELHSRSLRTDRWDGSGQTIEGLVVEPVGVHSDMLAKAVAAMGYTGVGCAQFLFDPDTGQSCFLEINPRFGASYAFVEHAGFDLTGLALELAGPAPAPEPLAAPPRKVHCVWTYGDLSGLVFSVSNKDITPAEAWRWARASVAAAVTADVHVTWSWSDPWPTLASYASQLVKIVTGSREAGGQDEIARRPRQPDHGSRPKPARARDGV